MVKGIGKNSIVGAIVIVVLIVALVLIYKGYTSYSKPSEIISTEEAAKRAIDYINQNILAGGATASLVGVSEESGVYKIKFDLKDPQGNERKGVETYVTKNGKLFFPDWIDLTESQQGPVSQGETTVGDFLVSQEDICKEEGKPIIYFFGSTGCPHCAWEHPIIEEVVSKFGDNISFHNNMDSNQDMDVFQKYSPGSIPTLVLGCKYYRVGSGEQIGKEQETKVLTALICKLTDGQPAGICESVQDLIDQIE